MKFLVFVTLIIATLNVSGQVLKKFFNKNGKVTKDSTKAASYILYQKEGPDSLWSVVDLNMKNIPLMRGFFLDEDFTIPYGKFVYYQIVIEQKKIDDNHSSIDTLIRVRETGFFVNGLKEGVWISYYPNSQKHFIQTFENNMLSGLSEEYNEDGTIFSRNHYIKGLREGDSYVFKSDSSVQIYLNFWHGAVISSKIFKDKDQMYNAYPGFNFEYHVYKYLKKLGIPPTPGSVMINFTITADGKLIHPEIQMGVNSALDHAIIEAFNSSPTWVPAMLNKKRIEEKSTIVFVYDSYKDRY